MGDATIRLSRASSYSPLLAMEDYKISIDGTVVGVVKAGETVEVSVSPGRHSLRLLGKGRSRSPLRTLEVGEGETASFRCHGPRYGLPHVMAALIKPDLWTSLRPSSEVT